MKKAWYPLAFMGLTSGLGVLLFQIPGVFFPLGNSTLWFIVRCLILAGLFSLILCGGAYTILNWRTIYPYFAKLSKYRPLLYQLVRRDFLAKYKRSVLGVLWSVLNPLLTMLVMTIVFSFLFRFDIENYPVYLLSGQILFNMFSETTNLSMGSVLGAAGLMKKVNVPKYIFPISRAISGLINFALSFVALIMVMLIPGAPFHWTMLYAIVPVFLAFVFSMGVGLVLSALVVFFRDINYIYGVCLTAVTYFTPLFYPITIVPDRFRWIISLNPLFHFVDTFRTCAIYGMMPSLWKNLICLILAISALGIGLFVFYKKQDQFILYI